MNEITLSNLKAGSKARVIQVTGKGSARRKLLDMGMVPGIEIQMIRSAPLGDPIEILIKGYNLSLRKNEAEQIMVQVI